MATANQLAPFRKSRQDQWRIELPKRLECLVDPLWRQRTFRDAAELSAAPTGVVGDRDSMLSY